jgi:hypothetical protein
MKMCVMIVVTTLVISGYSCVNNSDTQRTYDNIVHKHVIVQDISHRSVVVNKTNCNDQNTCQDSQLVLVQECELQASNSPQTNILTHHMAH